MGQNATNYKDIFKIVGAYIAFLIGSGFATGQEVMQFFVAFSLKSIGSGIIVAAVGIYICTKLLLMGRNQGYTCNEQVYRHLAGKHIGTLLTWYTIVFIVAVNALMISGSGSTLMESYGVPSYLGSALMTILTTMTLLLGLKRLIEILSFIGPLLILLTITIAIFALLEPSANITFGAEKVSISSVPSAAPNWFVAGFLYAGLTVPGLASLLPAIGKIYNDDRTIKMAAIIGPVTFGFALIIVAAALLAHFDQVQGSMVPMLNLANIMSPTSQIFFAIIIFIGIFTTTTPLVWSVASKFFEEQTKGYKLLVITIGTVSYFASMIFPFSAMVNIIFPTIGYMGLFLLACMIFDDAKASFIGEWRTNQ